MNPYFFSCAEYEYNHTFAFNLGAGVSSSNEFFFLQNFIIDVIIKIIGEVVGCS
jgi:hypothetical protein